MMEERLDPNHALYGADLRTLLRVFRRYGPLAPERRAIARRALLAALGRLPFTLIERAYEALHPEPPAGPPPLFILGHWRSGTTHLYNIMSKADDAAYVSPFATALPHDFLILGSLLRPLLARKLPRHRYIDRVSVTPDAPQEDEIALANLTPVSFSHALYFPRHFDTIFHSTIFFDGLSAEERAEWEAVLRRFYRKLAIAQPGKRLIIKNPVYTARPAHLRRLFPQARFVHIHRDPYRVFVSMRNFYQQLLRQFALQPYDHLDIDEIILTTYAEMMDRFESETKDWPADRLIAVSFAQLERAPLETMAEIYARLGLDGFDRNRERFARYLESVAGYRKNRYRPIPADVRRKVEERWGRFLARYGDQAA